MGKVTVVGGKVGMEMPSTFKENFADNTWAQIVAACEANAVPETWVVGDQKTMLINGYDYAIDIIGKGHDTYTAGGKAPLTFQMHDLYMPDTGKTGIALDDTANNSCGWTNCDMRTTTLPTLMALMPSEVQVGIKEVNKATSVGNQNSKLGTTADKLFLLSEIEVAGHLNHSASGEGTQYAYYAAGNSAKKKWPLAGHAYQYWWTRSPFKSDGENFCSINYNGETDGYIPTSVYGVAFAFCF